MLRRPLALLTARRAIVAIGIGAVGVYVAYVGAADWYRGVRSDNWPTTSGSVLGSEVERVPGHGRVAARYKAHLLYRYEVDGRRYLGNRISFGRLAFGGRNGDAESLTHEYPPGSAVQVHYDPVRPDLAVLQAGWTWSAIVRTTLGIVVVVGVFLVGARGRGLTSSA